MIGARRCPWVLLALLLATAPGTLAGTGVWQDDTFADFRRGSCDDGGVNLYAAADGTVRAVRTFDYNRDGANDLLFICGHDNNYAPPCYIYLNDTTGFDPRFRWLLESSGTSAGALADLDGDGWVDAVLCGTSNGTNSVALDAIVYYGAAQGYAKRRTVRLPTYQSRCVTVADADGDGDADLIFAQGQEPGLVVYDNSVEGFAATRKRSWACPAVSACRVVDTDADGYDDLVALCGQQIMVFPGSAAGIASQAHAVFSVEGGGRFALGDLDGDGRLDLVVANPQLEQDAHVYWGGAAGRFDARPPLTLPSRASRDVAIADLNQDGKAEIILANFGADDGVGGAGTVIHWGANDETRFTRRTELNTRFATGLAVADLDGDAALDLVVCCKRDAASHLTNSFVYFNRNGSFPEDARTALPTLGAVAAAIGDVDRNGRDDVLFLHEVDGTYGLSASRIYWNDGHGRFGNDRVSLIESRDPFGHSAADFNLDGHLDLAIANSYEYGRYREEGSYVYWGGQDGEWTPARRTLIPTNFAVGVVSADLNRDGWLDLAFSQISESLDARVAFAGEGKHSPVFWGGPEGFDVARSAWLPVDNPRGLTLADLNQDGWLDLVYSNITADFAPIFWGAADGFAPERMTPLPTPGQGSVSINCADLNADGWLDVLIACFYDTSASPWISDRASYVYYGSADGFDESRRIALPTQAPTQTAIADFDRDGRLDIFFPNYTNSYKDRTWNSYLYYNSPQGFAAGRRTSLFTNSGSCALPLDFDGDGWLDLAVGCHMTPPGNHRAYSFVFHGGPAGFSDYDKQTLYTEGAHELTFVDPGHIYHRRYELIYTSDVHDAGTTAVVGAVSWDADTPHGSSLRFQVRAADTHEALETAAWQGAGGADTYLLQPGARPAPTVRGRFVQYRVVFASRDGSNYPLLREVHVDL